MTIETFADLQAALETFTAPQTGKRSYDLDRMRRLLDHLGNPQESFRTVHIAGTSGKTSTAYYVAALLKESGIRTGLSVSPHIVEVNDRVQIDCQPLLEPLFCAEFELFMEQVEQSRLKPVYFELMVAFAYWEFARQAVEYAVVEVGVGGLLDPTNTIQRNDKICVITDIGYDHMNLLGSTLGEIATQKAGIIHRENIAFMYKQSEEVMEAVDDRVTAVGATLHLVEAQPLTAILELPLFQQRNFMLALAVAGMITTKQGSVMTDRALLHASRIHIPGRMETLTIGNKTVILDSAHNGQKIQTLFESIRAKYPHQHLTVLLGFIASPVAYERMSEILAVVPQFATHIIVTTFGGPQDAPHYGVPLDEITSAASHVHEADDVTLQAIATAEEAFTVALNSKESVVIVAGSVYLLNHIRPLALGMAHKKEVR